MMQFKLMPWFKSDFEHNDLLWMYIFAYLIECICLKDKGVGAILNIMIWKLP